MLLNVIVGFIIPWIFGILLYKKAPKTVLIFSTISSVLSHTINALAHYIGFWEVTPTKFHSFAFLPYDLGVYSILGCYLIYFIHNKRYNPYLIIFIFTISTTLLELVAVIMGKVIYGKGWNIGWTFVSYLVPYAIVYLYYLWLRRYKVL